MARFTFWRVRRRFVWMSDKAQFMVPEHWKDWSREIMGAELRGDDDWTFKGDCDDHALSCGSLLAMQYPDQHERNNIGLATCWTEVGDYHVVAWFDDPREGVTYVLDNRARGVVTWDRLPYRWHTFNRLSAPGEWFEVGA